MPVAVREIGRLPRPDERAFLDHMPGSTVPVIRQPFAAGDPLPYWAGRNRFDGYHLYDVRNDPAEDHNLAGTSTENEAADKLRECLRAVEAPEDHFVRLGLS